MQPLIGITTSFEENEFAQLRRTYALSVNQAGGTPVLLAPIVDEDLAHRLADQLDGLILSGGGDVDPAFYHEDHHEKLGTVNLIRDQYEMQLVRAFLERKKPILAICRGCQLLNVVLGGTLIQDVPSYIDTQLEHDQIEERHVATHLVKIEAQTKLAEIVKAEQIEVNSFHHQSVKQLAPSCRAIAYAPDGVVEAFEVEGDSFVLALQWHPECMLEDTYSQRIFHSFIQSCNQKELVQ